MIGLEYLNADSGSAATQSRLPRASIAMIPSIAAQAAPASEGKAAIRRDSAPIVLEPRPANWNSLRVDVGTPSAATSWSSSVTRRQARPIELATANVTTSRASSKPNRRRKRTSWRLPRTSLRPTEQPITATIVAATQTRTISPTGTPLNEDPACSELEKLWAAIAITAKVNGTAGIDARIPISRSSPPTRARAVSRGALNTSRCGGSRTIRIGIDPLGRSAQAVGPNSAIQPIDALSQDRRRTPVDAARRYRLDRRREGRRSAE